MPGEELSPRTSIPNLQSEASPLRKHVHRKCGPPKSSRKARRPEPSRTLLNCRVLCFGQEGGGASRKTERCGRLHWALPGGAKVGVGKTEGCALKENEKDGGGGVERIGKGPSPAVRLQRLEGVPKPRLQLQRSWYQQSRVLCSRPNSDANALGKPVPQLGPQSPHI